MLNFTTMEWTRPHSPLGPIHPGPPRRAYRLRWGNCSPSASHQCRAMTQGQMQEDLGVGVKEATASGDT